MRIINTDYGIASRCGNTIFLNKKLSKYPELRYKILNHEKSHSSGWNLNDLIIDLTNGHLNGVRKQYWKFIITNPKAWTEFLPITFYKGKIQFNPNLMLFYGMIILSIGLIGKWM